MPRAPWEVRDEPTTHRQVARRACIHCEHARGIPQYGGARVGCARLPDVVSTSAVLGETRRPVVLEASVERSDSLWVRVVDAVTGRQRCGAEGRFWIPHREPRPVPARDDPEQHCPDADTMKARIADRFGKAANPLIHSQREGGANEQDARPTA